MKEAKCICKNKAGKEHEFGRKWFIGRLSGNYALELTDEDFALEDVRSLEKVLSLHEKIFGKPLESITEDQAFWPRPNLAACNQSEIREVGIAPRRSLKWKVPGDRIEEFTNRRAGVEPIIGHIKRRGPGKPKMKSDKTTKLEGQRSILSLNLARLARDLSGGQLKWSG